MAARIIYKGKLSDALDLLDAQEIFDGAMKAAVGYEAGAERAKVLKDQYAAAQKAKDKPLMEKLNVEIRLLNFTARTGIHDHIVVPAVARLYTQKTGQPAPAAHSRQTAAPCGFEEGWSAARIHRGARLRC